MKFIVKIKEGAASLKQKLPSIPKCKRPKMPSLPQFDLRSKLPSCPKMPSMPSLPEMPQVNCPSLPSIPLPAPLENLKAKLFEVGGMTCNLAKNLNYLIICLSVLSWFTEISHFTALSL